MPWETYQRLCELGYNFILSLLGTIILHLSLSYATQQSWLPDPFLSIHVSRIHRCLYGSHSGMYTIGGNINWETVNTLFGEAGSPSMPVLSKDMLTDALLLNASVGNKSEPQVDGGSSVSTLRNKKDYYEFWDIWLLTALTSKIGDLYGYLLSKIMWIYLWILCDYRVSKHDILNQLDGTIFYEKTGTTRRQAVF
jgi:Caleosin related protein